MTPQEVLEIKQGKEAFESAVAESRKVKIPKGFSHLQRRIQQIKCSSIIINETLPPHIHLIVRYLLGTAFITYQLLLSKFGHNKISQKNFSIWESNIDPHATDKEFIGFLESKQIVDLESGFLFITSNNSRLETRHVAFFSNPIYEILKHLDISFFESLSLIKDLYINFYLYLKASLDSPDAKGLFKDFLVEPIIKLYSKKGLTKVYRTVSSINIQEFWCESVDFHTVLYSTNSKAFQYKNMPFESMPEHPYFSFAHMGTVWTWDELSAEWLRKINVQKIKIVGPILLYPLPHLENLKASTKKRLLLFDVIPHEVMQQEGYNYYSQSRCLKFLSDILETAEGNWEVSLKPKRSFHHLHSKKYIEYVKMAEEKFSNFKMLSPKSNLFEEISNADIVISMPLSSPFCIAKYLNIPAIYYDPSGDLDFRAMGYKSEDYIENISDLKARIAVL